MPTFDLPPLLWWGLPLAAAPLAIHLLSRLRQRRVPWAAMEFLLASQRRFRTRVLLRQLLLLALRTLAVLGLVVALAGPRWSGGGGFAGTAGATHVLVLDDSASMADASGGDSAFDRGRRMVERLATDLAASGARHRLAVAVSSGLAPADADGPPACVVPLADVTPGGLQEIRDAVARLAVGDGAFGLREAASAVMPLLETADRGPRILWLAGDFRSRDWGDASGPAAGLRRAVDAGWVLRLVDCGADPVAPNVTVERLEVVGGVPAEDVPVPVEVELRNDSTTTVRGLPVSIREDGGSRSGLRFDEIPPGGTAVRRFDVRFTEAGSHSIEAEIPGDTLVADDVRRTTLDVSPVIDVLVVDGGGEAGADGSRGDDAFHVTTALAPGRDAATGLRTRVVPASAVATTALDRFASVWLLDVPALEPAAIAPLEAFVRDGGGVVFFCGPRTRAEAVNAALHRGGQGLFPVPLAGAVDLLPAADPSAAVPDVTVEDHPVVAALAGQRNPLLAAVRVDRAWAVARDFDPTAGGVRRLLSLRGGGPLAVEKRFGSGLVVAVLTTAAPVWNNWARANPSWVVLLLELEGHLARPRRRDGQVTVGQPVAVRLQSGVDEPAVEFVVPPRGDVVRRAAVPAGTALEASVTSVPRAGLCTARWRTLEGAARARVIAVNVDPAEGRLRRAGRQGLDAALRGVPFRYDAAGDGVAAAGVDDGRRLAVPLLVGVVGLLLAEQWVAFRSGYHPPSRRPSV